MANVSDWKAEDIQHILVASAKTSCSPFYTLPVAHFTDVTESMDEVTEEEKTVIRPTEAQSPSFDLFDDEIGIWGKAEVNPSEVKRLGPEQFLAMLEDDEFAESWTFTDLLFAADNAVVSDEYFEAVLTDFAAKQKVNPLEMRKLVVLALITAKLSQPIEASRDIFAMILIACSSIEEKDDGNVLLDVWSDVFATLISENRLNLSVNRHFLDLFERRLHARKENVSSLLSIITETAESHWTQQRMAFLFELLKTLTSEEQSKTHNFYVNEFDLMKLVKALLHVITTPILRPIAASQDYFSLLNILVRYVPAFVQKSADFVKIANEVTIMTKNGECSTVSPFLIHRLQNVANSYSAN